MQMIRPRNAVELIKAVRSIQGEGYLVAGCTDFLPQRNGTWWEADCLIDLLGVKDMQGIYRTNQVIRIGAVCTHSEIENHPVVRAGCPALSHACSQIGSRQIRNRATIGGNICSASPAGDIDPVLLAVRAEILCMNLAGNLRKIPAEKFISGKGATILQPGEAVIRIEIPLPPAGSRSAFAKLGERKKGSISKISLSLASEIRNRAARLSTPYEERLVRWPISEYSAGPITEANLPKISKKPKNSLERSLGISLPK